MALSQDEILQIMKMVDRSEFGELRLETGELKLVLRKKGYVPSSGDGQGMVRDYRPAEPQGTKPTQAGPQAGPGKQEAGAIEEGTVPIKSPMLGTVYRRPSPDAPAYVDVGSFVKEDDTVCLIEVMKVFTAVKAGVRGTVLKILIETNEMVEYGQPLFIIRPEADSPRKD